VQTGPMTTPFDYDFDPERFRLAARATQQHLTVGRSLYHHLAEVLVGVQARRILDIGCGEGALRAALPAPLQARLVGLDASATMLGAHPPPVVRADAAALPFVAGVFDATVAVNVLDISSSRPSRSARPTASWPGEDPSSPPPPAATTLRSWPTSGGRRPPASTPRTRPGWWRRCLGRCRSSGGMPRWCGCPTATRSATT
jgi:SAM-dependent methyltransferase